ncbi:MAG: PilZ domain-containing protein [Thermodesulfobacteriota bacterium]
MDEILQERRQHRRYPAQSGTFAAFMPYSARRGQIVDISKGGLAFHYITDGRRSSSQHLAILVIGEGVFVNHIRCETVSDFTVTPASPFSAAPLRRCSVKFLDLQPEQVQKIDRLIAFHTIRDS